MKSNKQYKDLYQMLDNCTYLLNNQIEGELFKNDCNEELYEALGLWSIENTNNEQIKYLGLYTKDFIYSDEWEKIEKKYGDLSINELIEKDILKDELLEEIYQATSEYGTEGTEIYQSFIVDDYTKEILEDFGEFVYTIEDADLNIWGVMHYGTAWSYVMGSVYPIQNKERYLINNI